MHGADLTQHLKKKAVVECKYKGMLSSLGVKGQNALHFMFICDNSLETARYMHQTSHLASPSSWPTEDA